jgi:hypothetical protein
MANMKSLLRAETLVTVCSKIQNFEQMHYKYFSNEPQAYLNWVQDTFKVEIEFIHQVHKLQVCIDELEKINESFFGLLKQKGFVRITFYKRFEAHRKMCEYVTLCESYLYDKYVVCDLFPEGNLPIDAYLREMYKRNRLYPREFIYTPHDLLPLPF